MTRKEFMRLCGASCLAMIAMPLFAEEPAKQVQTQEQEHPENKITVAKQEFVRQKKDKIIYRKYIIVTNAISQYPIVLYRFDENEYAALLMQCTHQGAELSVQGDMLTCNAHGSEFSNRGVVLNGPAEHNLITYNVTSDETNIYISIA